jgi:hypothetical protein
MILGTLIDRSIEPVLVSGITYPRFGMAKIGASLFWSFENFRLPLSASSTYSLSK